MSLLFQRFISCNKAVTEYWLWCANSCKDNWPWVLVVSHPQWVIAPRLCVCIEWVETIAAIVNAFLNASSSTKFMQSKVEVQQPLATQVPKLTVWSAIRRPCVIQHDVVQAADQAVQVHLWLRPFGCSSKSGSCRWDCKRLRFAAEALLLYTAIVHENFGTA